MQSTRIFSIHKGYSIITINTVAYLNVSNPKTNITIKIFSSAMARQNANIPKAQLLTIGSFNHFNKAKHVDS